MRHSLWQSFVFAGRGLQAAFWSQRAMRVHIALAGAVTVAAAWLRLSAVETAALVLSMATVLAAELLNTAVETLVDLQVGEHYHALAGRAKDMAAAAVLVAAAGAAIVGLIVLAPPVARALGAGRLEAVTIGRAATLLGVIALVVLVLRRLGDRAAAEQRAS